MTEEIFENYRSIVYEEIMSGKEKNMKWSALNLWILKSIIIFTYPILIYLHPYFACISLCRLKWYTIYNFKSCFCCSLNLSHIWFHLLKIQDASFKNLKLSQAFKNPSQIFFWDGWGKCCWAWKNSAAKIQNNIKKNFPLDKLDLENISWWYRSDELFLKMTDAFLFTILSLKWIYILYVLNMIFKKVK